jgi:DNA-binding LacI/PurR family transcriptional regulator
MADVAARAGVSRALVSIVFRDQAGASDATRARILDAARQLGYEPNTPARLLAQADSRLVGVMMNLRNPFHADIAEGLYAEAAARGLDLIVSAAGPGHGEAKALEVLRGYRCAGHILLGPTLPAEPLVALGRLGPCAIVGRSDADGLIDSLYYDDDGVRLALDCLAAAGHRRIAYISGGGAYSMRARAEAYAQWMATHLPGEPADIVPGADTEEGGLAAAALLLARGQLPTALVAANDRCALGLLAGLGRAGAGIPGDVSVIGYDDIEYVRYGGIDLTTVRQDPAPLAAGAVQAVADRLADRDAPARTTVLAPELVVRGTVAAPRPADPPTW